jgi:outer membrane lipopolysaccharide assembly protein LptE/RlpB
VRGNDVGNKAKGAGAIVKRGRIWAGVVVASAILVLAGCGYHVAGRASRLPETVHTIAIPAFDNRTQTYRIEQLLTEATVREFITRTKYRIVNKPDPEADATLKGVVLTSSVAPVTFDSTTGRASSALVTVTMTVKVVDRNGKVLFENPQYVFREQYQVSRELSSFFQEEGPAVDRMSRDFARTLVSNVLEAF